MNINKRKTNYEFKLLLENRLIEKTDSIKYLGVTFDEKLNWKCHLKNLENKLSRGMWAISKLRRFVNSKTLRSVYYSLIYSHLIYCISSWGSAPQKHLDKIFVKQKKTIRIMTFSPYLAHTTPIFYHLKLLKLEDIFKLRVATLAFKIINLRNSNNSFTNKPRSTLNLPHSYNTRAKTNRNIYPIFARTRLGQSSLEYQIPSIWNKLPNNIRQLSTINSFKYKFKQHLVNQYNTNFT